MDIIKEEVQALIVDDNPVSLLATKNVLKQFHIKIAEAYNGVQALEYLKNNQVDFVIMDLLMPGLSGIETTKLIRSQIAYGERIRVIAASGMQIENLSSYLRDNLLDGFLEKPLDVDRVDRCLSQWFYLTRVVPFQQDTVKYHNQWEVINRYYGSIKEMNLQHAIHITRGDADYFLRLVLSSLPQLKQINEVSLRNPLTPQIARQVLHSLKSMLYYISATNLTTQVKQLEEQMKKEKEILEDQCRQQMQRFLLLAQSVSTFADELERATIAYNNNINKLNTSDESSMSQSNQTYSKAQISRQIEILLSYVCRFEYIEIVNGLNQLLGMLQEPYKDKIRIAIEAINEFDYEKVKKTLVFCWNEINEGKEIKMDRGEAR